MARKKVWMPEIGALCRYVGKSRTLSRGGHTLRVVAETSGMRMVCEAMGKQGSPVRVTVKVVNLVPEPPGLFD